MYYSRHKVLARFVPFFASTVSKSFKLLLYCNKLLLKLKIMSLFQIKTPCHEDWNSMKIGLHSRHCESCKKDVMDFTKMSREEILTYLLMNREKQVCGRITEGQLDFHHTDILVTINSLSHKERNTNFAFNLLSIGTLLMASCEKSEPVKNHTPINLTSKIIDSNLNKSKISQTEQTKSINQEVFAGLISPSNVQDSYNVEEIVLGDINIDNYDTIPNTVQKMPEFVGGYDSLMKFMKENIKYPKWEKKNKIEAFIYASFIVNTDGTLSDINTSESVNSSKNFDTEVIRVIKSMPKWIPGENEGKKVRVRYHLPVKFRL